MINDKSELMEQWWSLSYASWLTLPRVFIQEMPKDWQDKFAELLKEYDAVFENQPNIGTRVQIIGESGKLIKTPEWLINYRRPNKDKINKCKKQNVKY